MKAAGSSKESDLGVVVRMSVRNWASHLWACSFWSVFLIWFTPPCNLLLSFPGGISCITYFPILLIGNAFSIRITSSFTAVCPLQIRGAYMHKADWAHPIYYLDCQQGERPWQLPPPSGPPCQPLSMIPFQGSFLVPKLLSDFLTVWSVNHILWGPLSLFLARSLNWGSMWSFLDCSEGNGLAKVGCSCVLLASSGNRVIVLAFFLDDRDKLETLNIILFVTIPLCAAILTIVLLVYLKR